MAYNYPRRPKSPNPPEATATPQPQTQLPSVGDVARGVGDLISAPFAGFFNPGRSYEQWMYEKKRKKRGLPPNQNWLQKLI